MAQKPTKSLLFVTKLIAGAGISLTRANGTGIVTVAATEGDPSNVAITGGAISGVTLGAGVGSSVPQQAYNAVATAPTANALALTGANICGGSVKTVLNLTAALGAGAAADLPTVAALVAAMQAAGLKPVAGGSYELDVLNTSSGNFAWTITTATGWTLQGTMTVAQNTVRKCIVTFTSLTAAVLQSIGQYANAGV